MANPCPSSETTNSPLQESWRMYRLWRACVRLVVFMLQLRAAAALTVLRHGAVRERTRIHASRRRCPIDPQGWRGAAILRPSRGPRRQLHASAAAAAGGGGDGRPDDAAVREGTLDWLRRVVVGLNLCPFAERPLRQGALRVTVVRGDEQEEILTHMFDELLDRTKEPGTTLVVCPEYHPDDFEAYLDMVALVEEGLIQDDPTFEGVVQVAPFHPLFRFEGSDRDGVDNWTNRAPYPLFHILREDEVTEAVDRLDGDAGRVWRRNAGLLQAIDQEMGRETFRAILQGRATVSEQDRLREILKMHRVDLQRKTP